MRSSLINNEQQTQGLFYEALWLLLMSKFDERSRMAVACQLKRGMTLEGQMDIKVVCSNRKFDHARLTDKIAQHERWCSKMMEGPLKIMESEEDRLLIIWCHTMHAFMVTLDTLARADVGCHVSVMNTKADEAEDILEQLMFERSEVLRLQKMMANVVKALQRTRNWQWHRAVQVIGEVRRNLTAALPEFLRS